MEGRCFPAYKILYFCDCVTLPDCIEYSVAILCICCTLLPAGKHLSEPPDDRQSGGGIRRYTVLVAEVYAFVSVFDLFSARRAVGTGAELIGVETESIGLSPVFSRYYIRIGLRICTNYRIDRRYFRLARHCRGVDWFWIVDLVHLVLAARRMAI